MTTTATLAAAAHSDIHWANIFIGIGGLATAGALLVSLFLLRQQMREQRQIRRDRRIEHASQVSFWLGFWEVVTLNDPAHPDAPQVTIEAHVKNVGTQPAMAPFIEVGVRRDLWEQAGKGSAERLQESIAEWPHPTGIGPGAQDDIMLTVPLPVDVAYRLDRLQEEAIIGELHFTDPAGIGWVRTSDGKLIERSSALWISVMPLSLSERHARLAKEPASEGGLRTRLVRRLLDYLIDHGG